MRFTIFREMLDYFAHISTVTDADMNWLGNTIRIIGETDDKVIEIEVTIKDKEVKTDGN